MRKYLLATAAAAALGIASASQAAISISYQLVNGPDFGGAAFLGPAAAQLNAPGANWAAFRLTATTDTGVIKGFDLSGTNGLTTSGNQLLQLWTDTDFDFVPNPNPVSSLAATLTGDSHFLLAASSQQSVVASETNNGLGAPPTVSAAPGADSSFGLGNSIKAAWALGTADYAASQPFAYVVVQLYIPRTINFAGTGAVGPAGDQTSSLVSLPASITIPTPEPASMTVLGLGALSLLARRRRA